MIKSKETKKLDELCDVTSSKRIYASEYKDEGVPFYRGKEIIEKQKGILEVSTEIFISEERYEEIKEKYDVPKSGDLLLTSVGTLGVPYVIDDGERFYFKDGNLIWFKNFDGLNSEYLYYWFLSPQGEGQLKRSTIGSSQSAFTITLLKDVEIELPSLDIQQKIASTLSAFDDLIENNTRRIEILEEMARRIYREWFVHFRYPGHENDALVDSGTELGAIPEGWEVKNVIDLYDTSAGGTPSRKKAEYFNGNIPWVKTKELNDSCIQKTEETITKLGLDNSSAKLFPRNSILVAMYGATIGQLGILDMDATTNQACCAVMEKEEPFDYSYIFFTLLEYRDKLIGLKQGAAQQNINQGIIKEFKILKPPTDILEEFQDKLYPLLDQIKVLEKKCDRLKETRDLLLPKLISGKIDMEKMITH